MIYQLIQCTILVLLITQLDAARILGIFPIPSVSHQVVFRALTYELAKKGHELVIVTPSPSKEKPENITEIEISHLYAKISKSMKTFTRKRGVVIRPDLTTTEEMEFLLMFPEAVLEHTDFIKLVNDDTQKFDLIIAEAYYYFPFYLSKKYDAPVIWFSSFYGLSDNYEVMGAPARHPILNPSFYRIRVHNLTMWEKIYEIYVELRLVYQFGHIVKLEEEMIRDAFGDRTVRIEDLKKQVDLLFVNAHPIFEGNRPVPPNVVYLGGLHMKPVQKLPEDLQAYLDSSKRGVVYLSLGTNVHYSLMDSDLLQAFVDGLAALPYDVLWKLDTDNLPNKPENVRIAKWFPQRDLLFHQNVKAFVTQGGLQSADEAIDAGVPVVGLPVLGDQFFNVEQYVRLGVGVKVDVETMTAEDLTDAVKTVIENDKYRRNMKKLGALMRDQPQTSLERAVWWTEYVIRHKGAKHLQPAAANVSWQEYFIMDVVFVVSASVSVVFLLLFVAVRTILRVCMKSTVKNKKSKKL